MNVNMILGFTKMDCFDDDFAPLQSSEPVAPPPAEDDDAPLFLGDEDVDVEKPQSVENNDVVTRCKVPTFLFISVYLTFCFNLIVELFRYSKEISKNQPKINQSSNEFTILLTLQLTAWADPVSHLFC